MFRRFILPLTVDMLFIYVCPSLIDAVGAHVYPSVGINVSLGVQEELLHIAVLARVGDRSKRHTKAL